ncbi:pentapeptide repeat-containing protein [Methylobacterium sp. P31]
MAGADLHGQDLSKRKLQAENLNGADLHDADLSFTILAKAKLHGANLSGANLRGTSFRDADLADAGLREAQTRGTDFHNAKLTGANLMGLTLDLAGSAASMEALAGWPSDAKYTLQSVGGLGGLDSGYLSLRGANLKNAKISGNLKGVDLLRADLRGANLLDTDNLSEAFLKDAIYDADTSWKIDPVAVVTVKR